MSVPGAVNQETGVIEGISAVPYIHGFSWYEALVHHQLPIHLENDANCVGLSELLAHPELENAACNSLSPTQLASFSRWTGI